MPSSKTEKFSAFKPRTLRPFLSVTRTPTVTRFTLTFSVSWGTRSSNARKMRFIVLLPAFVSLRRGVARDGNGTQEAQEGHKKHKKWVQESIFCAFCVLLCAF